MQTGSLARASFAHETLRTEAISKKPSCQSATSAMAELLCGVRDSASALRLLRFIVRSLTEKMYYGRASG